MKLCDGDRERADDLLKAVKEEIDRVAMDVRAKELAKLLVLKGPEE